MTAWKPLFRVTASDGTDMTPNWNDRLISLTVEIVSGDGDGDTMEAVFDDRSLVPQNQTLWALEAPSVGAEISVEMGYEIDGAPVLVGMGIFTVEQLIFEGPPKQMRIKAQSAGMDDDTKMQMITQFSKQTVGDIVTKIASFGGYEPVIDPELAAKKVHYLHQVTSNWHLMQELERKFGGMAKVMFGQLIFAKRDARDPISWAGNMGNNPVTQVNIRPEHLMRWQIQYDDRQIHQNIVAYWRDKDTHQLVPEHLAMIPDSGAQNFRIGPVYNTQVEALGALQSKQNQLRRSLVTGQIELAKGDPWIRAQMPLTITGMRPLVDGDYIVKTATHTLVKDTGILSTIELNNPGSGGEGDGGDFGLIEGFIGNQGGTPQTSGPN